MTERNLSDELAAARKHLREVTQARTHACLTSAELWRHVARSLDPSRRESYAVSPSDARTADERCSALERIHAEAEQRVTDLEAEIEARNQAEVRVMQEIRKAIETQQKPIPTERLRHLCPVRRDYFSRALNSLLARGTVVRSREGLSLALAS